jgi:prefoldin beta subunit
MAESEHLNLDSNPKGKGKEKGKGVDFGKEEAAAQAQHVVMQIQIFQQQQQSLQAQIQQMEISIAEVEAAAEALKGSKDETVYKAVGPIMIRKPKGEVEKDLTEMAETARLRIVTMRKQEDKVKEKIKDLTDKLSPFLRAAGLSE